MKRKVLYSLIGFMLLTTFLLRSGLVSFGISPYFHHRLNAVETQLFDDAILKLRERVENGKFDEIQNDIAEGRISRKQIVGKIKQTREQFGKPLSSEFFRSSVPEVASKYYENLNGTFYTTFYFTKTEHGEFFEDISWIVDEKNEAKILNYSGNEIIEWQKNNRERERFIKENYSNEIRIPFGARFIEIRY